MTPDVQEGEGTTLEFKESLSSSFARELVGLASTRAARWNRADFDNVKRTHQTGL